MSTQNASLQNLRKYYEKLLSQDTPFIEIFGNSEQQSNWKRGEIVIHTTTNKALLVGAANSMGSIKDQVHRTNEHRTDYRLFYLQHGPQTYEKLKRDLGQDIADTVQKLRDAASENSEKK